MIDFTDFQPMTDDKKEGETENKNIISDNQFDMNNINNMLNDLNLNNQKIDEEEQKRIEDRKKEEEERRKRIEKKIQEEEIARNEIRKKAAEYITEFEMKRQEEIAKKKKELEQKETNSNQGGNDTKGTSESWSKVSGNIDLKDSEYKGSKDVQRMREAMLNRQKDPNSEPLEKFFG